MNLHSRLATACGLLLALCLSMLACGKALSNTGTDSATHWLQRCTSDAECGSLECLCGVCTTACNEPASCPNSTIARCEPAREAGCSSAEPVCSAECQTDSDCSAVRSGLVCTSNRCSTPEAAPGGGGSGGAGADECSALPQCDFLCPDGTINPVDDNGCTHTCECVAPPEPNCTNEPGLPRDGCVPPAPDSGTTSLFFTCGDPVCRGYTPNGSTPLCSTEQAGDPCPVEGTSCDPQDECNRLLTCASTDPQLSPGGCPISRQRYKDDIRYLSDAELARYRDELLQMRLATWKYKHDPSKQRLGFIIDDNERSAAVDPLRDMVDLYGYTSMAVATLQLQAREIEALRRELAELRAGRGQPRVPNAVKGKNKRDAP
jgi:hypothetical protein